MVASNTVEERNQVLMDDGSVKNLKPENICALPRRNAFGVFKIPSTAILEQIIKSDKLVVVSFCQTYAGTFFNDLASEIAEVAILVQVDVDSNRETAEACDISAAPTYHFYRNGVKIDEMV